MGAAAAAAVLSISGQPASAGVTQSMTAIKSQESAAGAQSVQYYYYRPHYVRPGWAYGARPWGGYYRPYAWGGYPGYYPGYSNWGYPAGNWGYGYGWGPGVGIGVGPGFGIGFGF